jgi:hypothetical protein
VCEARKLEGVRRGLPSSGSRDDQGRCPGIAGNLYVPLHWWLPREEPLSLFHL